MFHLKLVHILLSVYFYSSIYVLKSPNIHIGFNHALESVTCYKYFPSISYSKCLDIFQSGKYGVNVMAYKRTFLLCSLCFTSNTPAMTKVPGLVLAYFPVTDTNISYENLAQGKPTWQVSTYSRDHMPKGNASSDLAVDGIWEPYMEINNDSFMCAHVISRPLIDEYWWMVDLEHIYPISKVVILNRSDCFWERLNNITVTVGESDQDMHMCGEFEGPGLQGEIVHITCVTPLTGERLNNITVKVGESDQVMHVCGEYEGPGHKGEIVHIICETPLTGQYVRISKPPPTSLGLCEVAVYR